MADPEYTLSPSVSFPVSGTRSVTISDERIFYASTLFERTREELRDKSWPRAKYTARAVDFSQISNAANGALALGDRVFITDKRTGRAVWLTLARIVRRLETPGDIEGEFESTTPSLGAFLADGEDARRAAELLAVELPGQSAATEWDYFARDSSNKNGGSWTNFETQTGKDPDDIHSHPEQPTIDSIPDVAGASVGEVITPNGAGGFEYKTFEQLTGYDPSEIHTHGEYDTLEEIPDITTGTVGYALLVGPGNTFVWGPVGDEAADHTHGNLPTLEEIEDISGATTGHVLTVTAGGAAEWAASTLPDWEYGSTGNIDGDKIEPGTIQHVHIAEVVEDQTTGAIQKYKVEILIPSTKVATGVYLENCLVSDDDQDVFGVGDQVMVAAPSEDQAAAGNLPLICGAFSVAQIAPPHAHQSNRWGWLAAWTG